MKGLIIATSARLTRQTRSNKIEARRTPLQAKSNTSKEIRRRKGGIYPNESQSQPRNFVPQKSSKQKINVFAEFGRNVRFCFTEICRTKIEPSTEFCRTLQFWTFAEFSRSPTFSRILRNVCAEICTGYGFAEICNPAPVCCGHFPIYLFTYLFGWFIPMNPAS